MRMILAVMHREFLIRTTSMTWSFYDLALPLAYLLLFGLGLNQALGGGIPYAGTTLSYNMFFLPGVLSMACFGIAINTSYGIFVDRDNGIFYEFLTYPMTRGQFLVGKILFNCLLALLQAALTVSLGALLLDIPVHWNAMGMVLGAVAFGTAGWFYFLSLLALRIQRNDAFNVVLNAVYFLLMFASSIFYPTEAMPAWLRISALLNPLTWHTDILRFGITGVGSSIVVLIEAGAFLLFLVVSFRLAVRTLNTAVYR